MICDRFEVSWQPGVRKGYRRIYPATILSHPGCPLKDPNLNIGDAGKCPEIVVVGKASQKCRGICEQNSYFLKY